MACFQSLLAFVTGGRLDNGGTDEARFVGAALAINDETQDVSFLSSRLGMFAK